MVEMALVLPVFLLTLLIVVNTMLFMSECARFDRVAVQVVLSGVNVPTGDMTSVLTTRLNKGMGYDVKNPLGFSAVVSEARPIFGEVFVDHRQVVCELKWTPWPSPRTLSFPAFGQGAQVTLPTKLTHKKSLVIDHFMPAAIF